MNSNRALPYLLCGTLMIDENMFELHTWESSITIFQEVVGIESG